MLHQRFKINHTALHYSSCYRATRLFFNDVLYVDLLSLNTLSVKSLACGGSEKTSENTKEGSKKQSELNF